MKLFYYITALMLTFVLFSCGGGNDAEEITNSKNDGTEEVEDTPVDATFDQLINGEIEENKTVVFETFVAPLPSTMYFGEGELSLDFFERRHQTEGRHMSIDIPTGTGKNRVESLPETYYQDDLKIHTADGDIAVVGDYVRVTGTFTEASDANYQYIDLKKIEKIDYTFDEAVFETAAKLTDDFILDEASDKGYAYIEGTLELMMFMSSYDGFTYSVNINQNMNTYIETVYINIGSGPSSMNSLPDNFTDADFILRDFKGEEFNGAKNKFRLYGTFNQLDIESKGMFTVEEIVAL